MILKKSFSLSKYFFWLAHHISPINYYYYLRFILSCVIVLGKIGTINSIIFSACAGLYWLQFLIGFYLHIYTNYCYIFTKPALQAIHPLELISHPIQIVGIYNTCHSHTTRHTITSCQWHNNTKSAELCVLSFERVKIRR